MYPGIIRSIRNACTNNNRIEAKQCRSCGNFSDRLIGPSMDGPLYRDMGARGGGESRRWIERIGRAPSKTQRVQRGVRGDNGARLIRLMNTCRCADYRVLITREIWSRPTHGEQTNKQTEEGFRDYYMRLTISGREEDFFFKIISVEGTILHFRVIFRNGDTELLTIVVSRFTMDDRC